jgi:hypothetical protein
MRNVPHDFVSVDMRGLKAALAAQAHALHVSVGRAVVRSCDLRSHASSAWREQLHPRDLKPNQ